MKLKQKTVHFSMELKLQKKKGEQKALVLSFVITDIYIFKVFITVIIILSQKITVYPITLACIACKLYFIS